LEFVNELLAGPTYARTVPIPGHPHMTGVVLGDCRMAGSSWVRLKQRLVANGFIIKRHPWEEGDRRHEHRQKIEMRFSA
jgi:hypothetical protein